jgi:hypothetical protein
MGVNRPGYWFPLALLGFALIGLAVVPARTHSSSTTTRHSRS